MVDLWAAGCIMYTMISGYQPFYSKYVSQLVDLIKQGKYDFNSEIWLVTSDSAKSLIRQLLQIDPAKRLNVMQALNHSWFTTEEKVESYKRYSDFSFKTNLLQNQRRLTRNFNLDFEYLENVKIDPLSFTRSCRKSIIWKELNINPELDEEK